MRCQFIALFNLAMKGRKIVLRPTVKRFYKEESLEAPASSKEQTSVKPTNFGEAIKKTWEEFCNDSTIIGFNYLRANQKRREKTFWTILMVLALLQCLHLMWKQYKRWHETPIILSFSKREIPTSHIPFPAVTICAENKYVTTDTLNFTRFFSVIRENSNKSEYVQRPAWLNDDEYQKLRSLFHVCGSYLVKKLKFPEYPSYDIIKQLNNIAPPFDENFLFCQFNQLQRQCTSLFEKIYTVEGICYTFNGLNDTELYRKETYQYQNFKIDKHIRKRDPIVDWTLGEGYAHIDNYDTYPERVLSGGLKNGLLVVLHGYEKNIDYVCRGPMKGFKVILHSPDDIPQVDKHFYFVPYCRDVHIVARPAMTYTTKTVKTYPPARRSCYYPNERYLHFFQSYTRNHCEIECFTNFTLRQCGCVHFYMPRLSNTRVCDVADIICYDKAETAYLLSEFTETGKRVRRCHCLPGCWELTYDVDVTHGTFNMEKILLSYNVSEVGAYFDKAELSRVTVCFRMNLFTPLKRSEMFGWGGFLASCGGLLGLFMGVTVVNLIQIFFIWTVRLFWHVKG